MDEMTPRDNDPAQAHLNSRDPDELAAAARRFFDRPPPPGYLDEWAVWLAESEEKLEKKGDDDDDGNGDEAPGLLKGASVLIFRLNREWLAFTTRAVVETTLIQPVHRIPHRSNNVLRGLVNLRGQLQLCFSLYGLLGVEDSSSRVDFPIEATWAGSPSLSLDGAGRAGISDRLIVLRDRERSEIWAFTADEVHGVEHIPRRDVQGVPSTLSNPAVSFSQAILAWEGRSVGYLDDHRVFAALRSLGR